MGTPLTKMIRVLAPLSGVLPPPAAPPLRTVVVVPGVELQPAPAVHVVVWVVVVFWGPVGFMGFAGAVFVIVVEEEMLHVAPAPHDGTSPALTRSIWVSLNRSAAQAPPALSANATRKTGRTVFIDRSRKVRYRATRMINDSAA
jgi:hypothetical protein